MESLDLVDRCFIVWGNDRQVDRQGIVRGDLGEGYFLCQYFDAVLGFPSTMFVSHISHMTAFSRHDRSPGTWEFFEDDEDLRFFLEFKYNPPKKEHDQ